MTEKSPVEPCWKAVRVREEHYTALNEAIRSNPTFESVEDYLDRLLRIVLHSEQSSLSRAEAETLKNHLAALGYM